MWARSPTALSPKPRSDPRGDRSWLTVNGEAIYGTVPYTIPGEGPLQIKGGSFIDGAPSLFSAEDLRFTARHDVTGRTVCGDGAVAGRPQIVSRALSTRLQFEPRNVSKVQMLGVTEPLAWAENSTGCM